MNRSEELCKLLGIEPNWVNITCKGLECKNKCNLFVLPSDKCRKIEKGEPCQHIYRYKEIYPDLTKPSNFVKLLKIYGAVCTYIKMIISEDGNELEDDLITDIIEVMSSHKKQLKILQGKAQVTKWDY